MLLMVKKGIRGGKCHTIYRYVKKNNKYMKKNKQKNKRHILNTGMKIVCMVWKCHKSCLPITLNGLKLFLNLMETL